MSVVVQRVDGAGGPVAVSYQTASDTAGIGDYTHVGNLVLG